jgi:hypothetical protein
MFIIRTAFWLSLVILCLPVGSDENKSSASAVGAVEAMSVARSAVGDLSKFCERNPGTCDTGNMVVSSFGQKARYGAQIVYHYLDDKFGSEKNPGADANDSESKTTSG